MRKHPFPSRELCVLCAFVVAVAVQCAEFELKDGDRIALIGGTFIERDQQYGYLETLLTTRFHDRKLIFRNLGWSGDNLLGESRAGFGKPEDGFKALEKMVKEVQPTKIIFNYGMSESFEGPAGIEKFKKNLDRMLDMLSKTCPNICIVSPQKHEKLPPPLPDPEEHNKNLRLYIDALKAMAEKRGLYFVNLYELQDRFSLPPNVPPGLAPMTDNGIHFTRTGHYTAAMAIAAGLGSIESEPPRCRISVNAKDGKVTATGGKVVAAESLNGTIKFQAESSSLPIAIDFEKAGGDVIGCHNSIIKISNLSAGNYRLTVDGKSQIGTEKNWQEGLGILIEPNEQQSEKLRQLINEKNQLFFHRWRPQNETYIFGFRKHEQGKNAVDIPQFDPLIAAKEEEIRKLAKPVPHTYTIEPAK